MSDWNRGPPNLPGGLIRKKGGLKYLGIFQVIMIMFKRIGIVCLKKSKDVFKNGNGYFPNCLIEGAHLYLTIWWDPLYGINSPVQICLLDFYQSFKERWLIFSVTIYTEPLKVFFSCQEMKGVNVWLILSAAEQLTIYSSFRDY